jgi:hypothetical protein
VGHPAGNRTMKFRSQEPKLIHTHRQRCLHSSNPKLQIASQRFGLCAFSSVDKSRCTSWHKNLTTSSIWDMVHQLIALRLLSSGLLLKSWSPYSTSWNYLWSKVCLCPQAELWSCMKCPTSSPTHIQFSQVVFHVSATTDAGQMYEEK